MRDKIVIKLSYKMTLPKVAILFARPSFLCLEKHTEPPQYLKKMKYLKFFYYKNKDPYPLNIQKISQQK